MKKINIEISSCEDCPHCQYFEKGYCETVSGEYWCLNHDRSLQIVDEENIGWPVEIPEWCGLEDVIES